MPIGVETFLQPAVQPVFDLIFSEGVKLFVRLTGGELEDTLVEWERELMLISDVLDDAVSKQFQSKAVQTWLQELQDLAFDMEDILSDFAIQAQEHEFNMNSADQQDDDDDEDDGVAQGCINAFKKMTTVARTTLSDCMSTLYKTISPGVQSKIEGINKRLHRIQSRTQFLHLSMANSAQQQLILQTESLRSQRESSSLLSESKVFGRDDLKQEIIARLLKDNDDPSNESYVVIPIVGNGGIGKTTLAQCVYNNELLKDQFNLKAWVCVSDVFDVKRITTTIINAATPSRTLVEFSTLDEAQTHLKQILMSTKFLIVLDDIWNDEYDDWFCLQAPFKYAGKGSKVIMTTRNEDIARMMIDRPMQDTIIYLKGLSEDDCWNLFKQHANNNNDNASDLAEMRDDIVKKCKGMPLAAKALGGLFKKTVDKRQRRIILESNIWSEEIGVLPVLRLSYDYLPSQLKRVFAYCSLFPKDHKFGKMEVILLWMAQGFLPNDKHMEDLGHKYFNDLESRSLLEQCPSYRYDGGMFVMHDLIHDLALWAAGGICYGRGAKNMTRVDRERIRHVFLTEDEDAASLLSQLKASHLRTFYDDGFITNLDFIQRFRYVRTLRLESDTIKVLPECIGGLKHLRFLTLKCKRLTELPESINNLKNLQTLWVADCSNLSNVPYIGSLKELRHLEIGRRLDEMPRGFEKLTSLRSLDSFKLVDGHGFRIKELKNLNHLQGKLAIWGLQSVSKAEDADEAQLHQKSGLDGLSLEWEDGLWKGQVDYNTMRDVAEQLKPATSIKECKLVWYMGLILPAWLGDPSFNNIVTIELRECNNCEELPPLGQLPCLKTLDIFRMDSIKRVGVEFYGCSNPFPALESLTFNNLRCWEKWEHIAVDSNRAFPCLQSLVIMNCYSLQGDLPPFPPSLKTLEIEDCRELSVLVSLPNLLLLEELKVDDCKSVSITTEDVRQGVYEEGNTPTEFVHLHLTLLNIRNCPGLISLPEHLLLPALEDFRISECENMDRLPSEMHKYTSLENLEIFKCPKLQCFPGGGGLPENLRELSLIHSIKGVQEWGLHRLHSLEELSLILEDVETEEDFNLSLPSSSLTDVKMKGIHNLKNLSVVDGTNLKFLVIRDCQKLESLVAGNSTSLSTLRLESCPKLQSLPPLSPTFISELELYDLGSSTDAIEQIPGPNLDLPSSLRKLRIEGFQNLKTITCSTLPNLYSLIILRCLKFESFGDTALPSHLRRVCIKECELIKPHLQSDPHHGVIRMDGDDYSLC